MARTSLSIGLAALALVFGCVPAPDLSGVEVNRGSSVLRSDAFQAAAANGRLLVAAGGAGVLVRSTDRGKTWSRQLLSEPSSIIGLTSCADGSFAALDFYKVVWFADSSGEQWIARPLDAGFTPIAIACDATNRVWVAGGNTTLASTADRGRNWQAKKLGGDAYLNAVQFVGDRHGFALGEFGIVLSTEDGGSSWTKQPQIQGDFYPYSAVFLDAKRGWVSGLAGVILRTEDGGKSWIKQENRSGGALYSLMHQGERLYGVGGSALVVLDGDVWRPLAGAAAANAPLVAAATLDEQTVFAVGYGGALKLITTKPERNTQSASSSVR